MILSSDNLTCNCPTPYQLVSGVCDNFTSTGLIDCLFVTRSSNGTLVCGFCPTSSKKI